MASCKHLKVRKPWPALSLLQLSLALLGMHAVVVACGGCEGALPAPVDAVDDDSAGRHSHSSDNAPPQGCTQLEGGEAAVNTDGDTVTVVTSANGSSCPSDIDAASYSCRLPSRDPEKDAEDAGTSIATDGVSNCGKAESDEASDGSAAPPSAAAGDAATPAADGSPQPGPAPSHLDAKIAAAADAFAAQAGPAAGRLSAQTIASVRRRYTKCPRCKLTRCDFSKCVGKCRAQLKIFGCRVPRRRGGGKSSGGGSGRPDGGPGGSAVDVGDVVDNAEIDYSSGYDYEFDDREDFEFDGKEPCTEGCEADESSDDVEASEAEEDFGDGKAGREGNTVGGGGCGVLREIEQDEEAARSVGDGSGELSRDT